MTLSEDAIVDGFSTFLTGRLADQPVSVTDIKRHTEGWSRQTISFTARWESRGQRAKRLVARVENEAREDVHDIRSDIEVEFRVMDAVNRSDADVPIPETYWYESDESLLNGRFFIVGHRSGEAPVTWDSSDRQELYHAWDDEGRSLPERFVDAVAQIHTLGADDVPALSNPPVAEIVEQMLNTQEEIYHNTRLKDEPAVKEVFRWLRENKPEVPEKTLVHGDFRIGNVLLENDGVNAVLDWELSRIGDPLYDLGYASTNYFAGKLVEPIERPELACSLCEREWLYREYENRTGRKVDPERVRYWRVFSALRMMTGGMAGAYRYNSGDSDDVRSAWFQYIVPTHIEDLINLIYDDRA